ncbi:MAG: DUF1329 domain-containing protein [Rhodocyclaceae bacterium]|nr:DUF1329 domain-containing protein [Rhodocyclaceae bacterium]
MCKFPYLLLAAAISTGSGVATAAVTPEEANALGSALTMFGAVKSANVDGSIPEYQGGLSGVTVASAKTGRVELKSPFDGEQPLLRIDASNMAEHKGKLSEGIQRLLQTRPGYYLNVYPSRRTASYTDEVLKQTVQNAGVCKTLDNGDAIDQACRGGMPFPIPKTGKEVMWNKLTAWQGVATQADNWSLLMTPNGTLVETSLSLSYRDFPYYNKSTTLPHVYARLRGDVEGPARQAGSATLYWDYLNATAEGNSRSAWSYNPGQRRVRAAPNASYDTPQTSAGGMILSDEVYLFSGKMDRWDMKLVGKQEMYIPYNAFKIAGHQCDRKTAFQDKSYFNPECERWELHRVWVVDATLKDGQRHVHSKRRYYLDEDAYISGIYEAWDQGGSLERLGISHSFPIPERQVSIQSITAFYDFNKAGYFVSQFPDSKESQYLYAEPRPDREMTADAIQGSGIR